MSVIDILIFSVYALIVLGVGVFFHFRNKDPADYFTGGSRMSPWHIGLSVVATDVGGGFSIGLGGLGFAMGLSGSWMLFTGLIGAWLSAVVLIPRVIGKAHRAGLLTFPQLLLLSYGKRVALLAGIISFIGYLGFTSSQLLAGAKLAVGTFPDTDLREALLLMGLIAVIYTAFGGIKAVIYTDTFQWILLLSGLICIALPLAYFKLGGIEVIRESVAPQLRSLRNIEPVQFLNWLITIVPIWFVGMTLYQRIYASRTERDARKAWFIAGLFEYPVMAFMGVTLGLFARIAADQGMFSAVGYPGSHVMDSELGLPLLLRHILPQGLMGIMMAAYFSAILSTADSCLIAASGNLSTDLLGLRNDSRSDMRRSQLFTLLVGALALLLAMHMQSVLELMLLSYAFMVSGLFVPVLGMLFLAKPNSQAALWSMLSGGTATLALTSLQISIPFGFDPILPGLILSSLVYIFVHFINQNKWRALN